MRLVAHLDTYSGAPCMIEKTDETSMAGHQMPVAEHRRILSLARPMPKPVVAVPTVVPSPDERENGGFTASPGLHGEPLYRIDIRDQVGVFVFVGRGMDPGEAS